MAEHSSLAARLRLKRAYEPVSSDDGLRILVDRLWPRGVSKAEAALYDWMKDIAPSRELRQWFGHDPTRWPEFQSRYRVELRQYSQELKLIRALAATQTVTLIYSAHDEERNDAIVLRNVLIEEERAQENN